MAHPTAVEQKIGRVVQVIGPVVDIEFAGGALPDIYNAVRIVSDEADRGTAAGGIDVVADVEQHLGENRVRTVAMKPTDGMQRGMRAIDTGGPISMPVGPGTLGRVLFSGDDAEKAARSLSGGESARLLLAHRIGGLEKAHITGNVNYDPDNHDFMVRLRAEKVERIAQDIPPVEVFGQPKGKVLVLGWGSTYGAITTAVEQLQSKGASVSSAHLRYLNPFPRDLGEVLSRFETVLVPELNLGQLALLVRAKYLVDVVSFSKVKGKPFKVSELINKITEYL